MPPGCGSSNGAQCTACVSRWHAYCPSSTALAFWMLGLLNNCSYVVMLACANRIAEGGVGMVFLAAELPTLAVKASAPYWFHLVRYRHRMWAIAALMAGGYTTVALGGSLPAQLAGVVCVALQSGLGEASCLAMSAVQCGGRRGALAAYASGTGFAGVGGYAWVALLHYKARLSLRATLLLANAGAAAWLAVYHCLLLGGGGAGLEGEAGAAVRGAGSCSGGGQALQPADAGGNCKAGGRGNGGDGDGGGGCAGSACGAGRGAWGAAGQDGQLRAPLLGARQPGGDVHGGGGDGADSMGSTEDGCVDQHGVDRHVGSATDGTAGGMGSDVGSAALPLAHAKGGGRVPRNCRERAVATAALWRYMCPLALVYFAEYAMQSGVWSAIGFPVTDAAARHRFYVAANWSYQTGVCVSRSSGYLWTPSMAVLWAMPLVQVAFLAAFTADAVLHVWYNWTLLVPAFCTGLLGGSVFVGAFGRLQHGLPVPPGGREFALAAASLGSSAGVVAADVAGMLLQGCLFRANHLHGAAFACGARAWA